MQASNPKIAIVRGAGLSKWEMQMYEPLTRWFDLVGIGAQPVANDIAGIGFPVTCLPTIPTAISRLPKFMPAMFSLFGDTQWLLGFEQAVTGRDLVHAVEAHNGFSLQAVRAKQKGLVKYVTLTIYENIPYLFHEFPKRRDLKEEVYAFTDHFLAANEMSRQMLILEGVSAEKISLVPQSVDTSRFAPVSGEARSRFAGQMLRDTFGLHPDHFIVLCVGRMVWDKGWYDIIATAKRLIQLKIPISFLCVGGGPEKGRLERLVIDLKLADTVKFTGLRPYHEMADIFRLADIFLYPSLPTPTWNAQFGGVLIEAMASGLPIVGTLSGGTRDDTVGESGGLFVQPQHFSGLVDAILALYKNPLLRKKIAQRNRKYTVTHYDIEIVASKIKTIWDKLLNSPH